MNCTCEFLTSVFFSFFFFLKEVFDGKFGFMELNETTDYCSAKRGYLLRLCDILP